METWLRRSRSNYEKDAARGPGKSAKHCSTENRQQEAQATAAKHQSELLRSTRSAVSTWYCCLLCIHAQIFDVHTVIVIHARTTWGHIIAHFWPMMTSVVMVLNLFLNLLQICFLQVPRRQPRAGDSVMGKRVRSIPVWCWHPHDNLHCLWPCCLYITLNGWLSICTLISIVNMFKLYSQ